jgi:hypothetical protein
MVACVWVYSPRTFLKFETRKWYFLHSEHPKNNKIINNNLSSLSGRKTEQFKRNLLIAFDP